MIIDSRELNPDSDLSDYTIEELTVAKGQVDETVANIRDQLKRALEAGDEAEVIAGDWYRRCRGALRFHLSLRDRLAARIREVEAQIKNQRQTELERKFITAARELLPDEIFTQVLEVAQASEVA